MLVFLFVMPKSCCEGTGSKVEMLFLTSSIPSTRRSVRATFRSAKRLCRAPSGADGDAGPRSAHQIRVVEACRDVVVAAVRFV